MNGSERRQKIIQMLSEKGKPVSGKELAKIFDVSRQVIVQDIALLRAQDHDITSTNQGYLLTGEKKISRVFKVVHNDTEVEEELNLMVDYGGQVEDVFVYHKVYGIVRAELHISNRNDIKEFLADLKSCHSTLLKNITSNYHYHTVSAPSEKLLDLIQERLQERGFLAELKDYEPINFWEKEAEEK